MISETSMLQISATQAKGSWAFAPRVETVSGYAIFFGQGNRRPMQGCYSMSD
jgi:hypothetical protein